MTQLNSPKLEKFERGVVFRIARGMPLIVAILSTLLLVVAGAALLFSFLPPARVTVAESPSTPPPVRITPEDIEAYLASQEMAKEASNKKNEGARPGTSVPKSSSQPPASKEAIDLATRLHAARTAATKHGIPWLDKTERYCKDRARYLTNYCFEWGTRVTVRGFGPLLTTVLELYDTDTPTETAVALDTNESYLVNPSNHAEKIAILDELIGILNTVPSKDAAKLAFAWGELRIQKEQARQQEIQREAARIAQAQREADMAYEMALTERRETRKEALWGLLVSLGTIFTTGIILAVLAIERNTRAIRLHAATFQQAREQTVPYGN